MPPRQPSPAGNASPGTDLERVRPRVVELAHRWLERAEEAGVAERRTSARLAALLADERGLDLAVGFVDRVTRAESDIVAARGFAAVVGDGRPPRFLSPPDRVLLALGARIAPALPWPTMPLARHRLRALVGHLVVDATPRPLGRHLSAAHEAGVALNLNLLGEAVLGTAEATRRRDRTIQVLRRTDVDYVSIKVSSVVGRLNPWDHGHAVDRVVEALRPLYLAALASEPPVFVNLDLEEYRDLDLTVDAFMRLLDEPELLGLSAGLALQAYLPDTLPLLEQLLDWAAARRRRGGADIRIRLVKGANLSLERVEAELAGWVPAPYATKHETDANYKRLLDHALRPGRLRASRIGLASHNLLDQALGLTLARERGVADRVDVEMLSGMAPGLARAVGDTAGGVRLYTPIVDPRDFDTAVAYLVRRLEETASPENFVRRLSDEGPSAMAGEVARFDAAVADRSRVAVGPRRTQDRHTEQRRGLLPTFVNEPDTDPALPANRAWAEELSARSPQDPRTPLVRAPAVVDEVVARLAAAASAWADVPAGERRELLHRVADELAARRGELLAAMLAEGRKTIGEADPEISEAIDFARWYGDRALELETVAGARFEPLGVVAVVPPWNFPVAIPIGGALAALAAGNVAILKPAPETPRCAEVAVEACRAAGVDEDLLTLLRCEDGPAGRRLVTHPQVDGVVLTGSFETATRFLGWRPDLRLLAETSGKNALVITPSADLDLAVDDLVASAFGHGGQKCSAASLAICVGGVERSERFRRQLVDAVGSLAVGLATELSTDVAPLVRVSDELRHARRTLEPGERWLVEPEVLDEAGHRWRPGVKEGVAPGSFLHLTECFGPVLGLMSAPDLDTALRWQHAPGFGLTGGIHSLDTAEIEYWLERVEVGNAYVNRHTTGAIVRRQPFGGWKRSNVGVGAKAGGPNYLTQLGTWHDEGEVVAAHAPRGAVAGLLRDLEDRLPGAADRLRAAAASDQEWWTGRFRREHDPTGLSAESNVLRYRPFSLVVVRATADADEQRVARCLLAARRTGAGVQLSLARPGRLDGVLPDTRHEDEETLRARLSRLEGACLRVVGPAGPLRVDGLRAGLRVVDEPVVTTGRIELLRVLREQAVSRTRHRYGHVPRDGRAAPGGSDILWPHER